MTPSKNLSSRVWVSQAALTTEKVFGIGASFPGLVDFPKYWALDNKKLQAEIANDPFPPEEEEELQRISEIIINLAKKFRDRFTKLEVMPDSLWQTRSTFPKENDYVFRIFNGGLVITEACAELFQQFRLGETQMSPLRIYNIETGKPVNDNTYYFLNICEWRNYFIAEESSMSLKKRSYQLHGYAVYDAINTAHDMYAMRQDALDCDIDLWHDPQLPGILVMTPALRDALRQARMDKSWFLYSCKMV